MTKSWKEVKRLTQDGSVIWKSGVYVITNVVNGHRYIGSSVSIKQRFYDHRYDLGSGRHTNPKLQAAYHKYGPENFVMRTLFFCPTWQLFEQEQVLLDLNPEYNLATDAFAPGRGRVYGPMSDEHKKKLSIAKLGKVLTPQHREALSRSGKGKIITAETREKLHQANKGKKPSQATMDALVGSKWSPETRAKLEGKPKSIVTRVTISLAKGGDGLLLPRSRGAHNQAQKIAARKKLMELIKLTTLSDKQLAPLLKINSTCINRYRNGASVPPIEARVYINSKLEDLLPDNTFYIKNSEPGVGKYVHDFTIDEWEVFLRDKTMTINEKAAYCGVNRNSIVRLLEKVRTSALSKVKKTEPDG